MSINEVQLYDGVRMSTSGNTDLPPNSQSLQRVILWDIGPEKPRAPKRPAVPTKGKEGDPEFDLAVIEFQEAKDQYAEDLKAWKKAKEDHAAWHKKYDGPIEIEFWSVDANDALDRDPRRYHLSSRTRGHAGRPNRGLPEGMSPGRGQAELEQRIRAGDADIAAARRADPVFGQQELR